MNLPLFVASAQGHVDLVVALLTTTTTTTTTTRPNMVDVVNGRGSTALMVRR